jgi:histidinol-phosphatase (PHP family)
MDFIVDFLDRHQFDLVLLSVHYFGGRPVHQRASWSGIDAATGTREYLNQVREAARFCERLHRRRGPVFQVLGHLDVVKRYSLRFCGSYDVSPFSELIDEILLACLAADLVPEINTSSLRQGLAETMPNAATVARYAALGGTCVSIGSDAHRPEDIGKNFEQATGMLRAAGIRHLATYQSRRRGLSAYEPE